MLEIVRFDGVCENLVCGGLPLAPQCLCEYYFLNAQCIPCFHLPFVVWKKVLYSYSDMLYFDSYANNKASLSHGIKPFFLPLMLVS